MATSPKQSFNHHMIAVFKRALAGRNADAVERALECGVDPSTPLEEGVPPINHLLQVSFDYNEYLPEGMTREEHDNNTARIVDAMLKHGLKVAEPQKYETDDFEYLIDHFMMCDRPGEVSSLVLGALRETIENGMGVYQPSITTHLQHLIDLYQLAPEHDIKGFISSHLNMMESVHETVRARLNNPETALEKELAYDCGEALGYWKGPFPRPSMATLLATLEFEGKAPVKEREILTIKRDASPANTNKPPVQKNKPAASDAEQEVIDAMKAFVQVLPKKSPQQVVAEIEAEFIGLDSIKAGLRRAFFRRQFDMAREVSQLKVEEKRHSAVMKGNPGLGKTTFARKKAEFLHATGDAGNRYAELGREDLVGRFIGATEAKITALLGMVDILFIDEAYALVESGSSNDFGKRVLEALLRAIENRPELVVFMAGYSKEMEDFIAANPGLRSRIGIYEDFEDMSREQLGQTLDLMLGKGQMTIDDDARSHILDKLDTCREQLGKRDFGNARLVRNIVQKLPDVMAERIFGGSGVPKSPTGIIKLDDIKDELSRITLADAKAVDYKQAFGTHTKSGQDGGDAPYQRQKIGFHSPVTGR